MADREWTAECVADHFEEAFRTLRKLPPVKPRQAGVNTRGLSRDEVAMRALHSTTNVPEILSALTNKTLR